MNLCNKNICIYHIYLIALALIIIYGFVIKQHIKIDLLEKKFAPFDGCDIWGILHFLLYTILGYYFPSYFILLFFIGVGYEFFEYYVGVTNNVFKQLGPMSTDGTQSWWYGRISDIIFNTTGIIFGMYLSPFKKSFKKLK